MDLGTHRYTNTTYLYHGLSEKFQQKDHKNLSFVSNKRDIQIEIHLVIAIKSKKT